jgi:two-component system chemotaxis response regulator CheY
MFKPDTRVLIVDNLPAMRKLVAKVCLELGFQDLTEAADVIEGWQAIQNAKPRIGLIIADLYMPKCTGLDLIKRIRSDSRFSEIPFLMISTETDEVKVRKALSAGVDNFLVKPFTASNLTDKLEMIYRKRATSVIAHDE